MPSPHASRENGKKGGRPKHRSTIDKELQREELRKLICKALVPMAQAQIAHATGLKYLVTRDKKTGKFVRVTEAMAKAKLGEHEEIIEVWEKDPSVQAFTDLLNRALDKPKEQVQDINLTGSLDVIAILKQRHARHQRGPQSSE